MSKKIKPEDVKSMIAKDVSQRIAPVTKRLGSVEETLKAMQEMLKAITKRLNVAPDNPEFDAGLASDSLTKAVNERFPNLRVSNPLVFPENRKKVERIFAKRGYREGDTVESVLKEAEGK